jgi:hypothetical protein
LGNPPVALPILVAKQHAFEPLARSSFKSSTRNFACKTGQYLSGSTASKTNQWRLTELFIDRS